MKRIILLLVLSTVLLSAQVKKPASRPVSNDTLISRQQAMKNVQDQITAIQKQGTEAIIHLQGRLKMLEDMTTDSIRVKK